MAWAAPAVAVAATVPFAAASVVPPPPPSFSAANGWKNPGNSCTSSCTPKQSYTTQVTVGNQTAEDFILEFTSYAIGVQTDTTGVYGLAGSQACASISTGCALACGAPSSTSICVPANTTSLTFYVTSNNYGASPNGPQWIGWQWVQKSTCTVASSDTAYSASSPPGC